MPAQWTANLVGEMHLKKISKKQLAIQMGVTPEYVSMVLNGHREPGGAEQRFKSALDKLVQDYSKNTTRTVQ